MNRGLLGVVAAGQRAVVHRAHVAAAMAAVHGRLFTFLRVVVITVNRALIATAACAGDCHRRSGGDWRVNKYERNKADQSIQTLFGRESQFMWAAHALILAEFMIRQFLARCVICRCGINGKAAAGLPRSE